MYLNLIDYLRGKWRTVQTARGAIPSQLHRILIGQGKSWDFQHSVECCLHFSFNQCYKGEKKQQKKRK